MKQLSLIFLYKKFNEIIWEMLFLPEPVESVVRPVDCEDGGSGVGLGHATVALQNDDLKFSGKRS